MLGRWRRDRYRFEASTYASPRHGPYVGSMIGPFLTARFIRPSAGVKVQPSGKRKALGFRAAAPGFLNDELRRNSCWSFGRSINVAVVVAISIAWPRKTPSSVESVASSFKTPASQKIASSLLWADPQQGDALVFWEVRVPEHKFLPSRCNTEGTKKTAQFRLSGGRAPLTERN